MACDWSLSYLHTRREGYLAREGRLFHLSQRILINNNHKETDPETRLLIPIHARGSLKNTCTMTKLVKLIAAAIPKPHTPHTLKSGLLSGTMSLRSHTEESKCLSVMGGGVAKNPIGEINRETGHAKLTDQPA